MRGREREKRDGERGQILAMTAISLVAVCTLVAVATDLGYFFEYRRRVQTGADGAAMAGAEQLWRDLMNDTQVSPAAHEGAASNGFTDGVDGTHVTVHHPPSSGFYVGKSEFVEAIITQPRPTIFMPILGFQSATVSARAVAGRQDSRNCIYALNRTATRALNVNGGATVAAACGLVDDSNSDNALNGGGQGGNSTISATSIAVTGGVVGCCFSPTPAGNAPPEADPLAGRAAPTFSSTTCDHDNLKINSGTQVLTPGVYCNGATISGVNTQVTFSPGVYVLNGGGLNVSGGTINGTGVTFYNTASAGRPYKPITISGGAVGALYAPTSGPMEAMLFFQDRAVGSTQKNAVAGGGNLILQGTLYFPTTPLVFSGSSTPTGGAAAYTILVADTIEFTGNSSLSNDFSSLSNRSPIKTVALAE